MTRRPQPFGNDGIDSKPEQNPGPEHARVAPVAAFTFGYIGVATVLGVAHANLEFLVYTVIMLVLVFLLWIVHRRVGLSAGALWMLSFWGLAHMSGGLVLVPPGWPTEEGGAVLYSLWLVPDVLKYDQVVHAYGFGVATWVCWQAMQSAFGSGPRSLVPTTGMMALAAAAGMGFGALNEVIEFAAVLMLPRTGVGGYINTGWDLVSNLVGAVVAVTLIWAGGARLERLRKPRP